MGELRALYLIFRHAPAALVAGRFEPNEPFAVYGLPARLLGAVLLSLAGFAVGDMVYWGFIRGSWDWPEWYTLARLGQFFGGILLSAFVYTVYRERRRCAPVADAEPLYGPSDLNKNDESSHLA